MPHLQLTVLTRYPEFAEELLVAYGALAVTFRDAGDAPVLEPGPGETPLWPRTRTVALFPPDADLDRAGEALRRDLPDGADLELSRSPLADADWVRAWESGAAPLCFGGRLWVCPRSKAVSRPGAVTVLLDAGLAFGTGSHPSTALCLDWLAGTDVTGASVLDYGCGSGLLGIAALKLGAARVTAVDHDPQALVATRAHADGNGVARHVSVFDVPAYRPAPHDIALANILANPLIRLAPRLAASVRPGGNLVLSGLLPDQAGDVMGAYREWFTFEPVASREGWVRLHGRRREEN